MSSETSSDQRSAVLNATMRTGWLYWPFQQGGYRRFQVSVFAIGFNVRPSQAAKIVLDNINRLIGPIRRHRENVRCRPFSIGSIMLVGSVSTPLSAQGSTATPPPPSAASANVQQTPAQRLLGDIAPKLADLTDSVLFGDVWERPQLSKRDRSLVTVSALIAMNRPDQLRSHLARARENGLTEEELVEAITHLAFYAGWPDAVTAVSVARDVFKK